MNSTNFIKTLTVNQTTGEVFNAITHVSKWWTENIEGNSFTLNDEFTVRFSDMHFSKQKIIEFIPNKKIVWLVTDSKLSWLKNKHEWTDTKIVFEISTSSNTTQLLFTHIGLIPEVECYKDCVKGWTQYVESLFLLITAGKGLPDKKNK